MMGAATEKARLPRFSFLLTYLCPSTRWEHGPSIKALHRILRCAVVAISCQVYPIFLASDSTSRRQVFLGCPRFLKKGIGDVASFRLSPHSFLAFSYGGLLPRKLSRVSLIDVSVTSFFYEVGLLTPRSTPNLEGQEVISTSVGF